MIYPDDNGYLRNHLYRITDFGASRRISGIAKRLHAVTREIVERYPDCPVARSWKVQIEVEIENIQGLSSIPRAPVPAHQMEWDSMEGAGE